MERSKGPKISNQKTALITGVTGQDGRHLSELLLSQGYKVFGLVNGQREAGGKLFGVEFPAVQQIKGDLTDISSLAHALESVRPDEIYNLGAISFVGMSFRQPELTANVTGLGTLRLLDAVRLTGLNDSARIYQASSSEMFGKVRETPQNELTAFHPRSPYGVAKTFAHYSCVNYREAYNMHVSCGILFNHEGERRGYEFVTRKISSTVAKIKLGKTDELRLGTLSPRRDWGYAGDYVKAMHLMLQQDVADDYVIATGETHSVEEFVDLAFEIAEIPDGKERFVKIDKEFQRPAEVDLLVGDPSKAIAKLGWKPQVDFENLVELMVKHDLDLESKTT
ncbi:MAG: GDP-mannose 4,6-dehydratase [Actinomycetota bacterium]